MDPSILQGVTPLAHYPDAGQLRRHGELDLPLGAGPQGAPQVQRDSRGPP